MTIDALSILLQNDKRFLSMMLTIKEISGKSGIFDKEPLINDTVAEVSAMENFMQMRDKEALRYSFWILNMKLQNEMIEFFQGPLLRF